MKEINYNKLICKNSGLKLRAVQAIRKDNPKRYREMKLSALLNAISINDKTLELFYQSGVTANEITNSLESSQLFKRAINTMNNKYVPTVNHEQLNAITKRVEYSLSDLQVFSQEIAVFSRKDEMGQFNCVSTAYSKYRHEAIFMNTHSAFEDEPIYRNDVPLVCVSKLSDEITQQIKADKKLELTLKENYTKEKSVPFTMEVECDGDFKVNKETVIVEINGKTFTSTTTYSSPVKEIISIDGFEFNFENFNANDFMSFINKHTINDIIKDELLRQCQWLDGLISKMAPDDNCAKDQYGDYRDIGVEEFIFHCNVFEAAAGVENFNIFNVASPADRLINPEYSFVLSKNKGGVAPYIAEERRDKYINGKASINGIYKF